MTLRVGISGYGLAGRYFHAPLLKGCGYDVVGVVTKNPGRKADALADFPKVSVVSTVDELLTLDLDLLVVASANIAHASDAIAGLKAGVPVVIDKPMGRTIAETKSIIDVSKETGVAVTTYFNRLFDSDALTVKKALAEGVLGNVFRLDSRFERFRPDTNPKSWREANSAADGGGNLLDLGPHLVSLALNWFGPAELTYASVRSIKGLSDDDIVINLKHANGVDSYLSASSIIGADGPRIRLSGTEGSLVIKDLDYQEPRLREGEYPAEGIWNPPAKTPAFIHRGDEITEYPAEPGNYATFYKLVGDAIAGKGAWPVTTDEALAVANILEEARAISIR
ncbi:MAG: Gfo/Idh/MocA family oxidoreductase [Actinomycetota bacterium]